MAKIKSRFQPYQMKHLLTFNKLEDVENPYTGIIETKPVPDLKKHCAIIKKTLTQKYTLVGTNLEDTINVAIRHTRGLTKDLYTSATLDNTLYNIVDISSDNDNHLSYDIITLRKVEGNE